MTIRPFDRRWRVSELAELVWLLFRKDLRVRYPSTLAFFVFPWLRVAITFVVLSVVFMRVVPLDVGAPYPVFLLAGLLVWNQFAGVVAGSSLALVDNTDLVRRTPFPRWTLVLSAATVQAFQATIHLVMLYGLAVAFGLHLPATSLLALPILLLAAAASVGVGLALAIAGSWTRSASQLAEMILQPLFYVTPVLYAPSRAPAMLRSLYVINPLSTAITSLRAALIEGRIAADQLAYCAISTMLVFGFGALVFRRYGPTVVDYL
jgi:ABC-type polysaccharide/polyol phosphate export permease